MLGVRLSLRVCLGPIGAIVCLVLAATVPLELSSDEDPNPEPSEKVEAPKGDGGESAAPKEKDLGVKLKDPNASAED